MQNTKVGELIRRWVNAIFMLGIYSRLQDAELARRLVLINALSLLGIMFAAILGVISCNRGQLLLGSLDLTAALLLSLCNLLVRRTVRYELLIYFGMSVMTGLYGFLFFSGGAGGTGHLWYYTYPLFSVYIMGRKKGSMFNALLLLPSFIYLLSKWPANLPPYTQDFILRFIPSVTCIFFYAVLFEGIRQKTLDQLQNKQAKLKETIDVLQRKEFELQRARDDLEGQVEARTRELRQSNEELRVEMAERRRLQTQLLRAEKMQAVGTLAGGVAHDLNNILSGITSYPELLLQEIEKDDPMRHPLEVIQRSGQKAVTIVQDLLTLSRRNTAIFQRVDLGKVVSDYLASPEFMEMISLQPDVSVEKRILVPEAVIMGSDVHLSKTIMNLVTNSVEAMPRGGKVEIEIDLVMLDEEHPGPGDLKTGRYIKLSVADTGAGMTPEILERIFEPFFTTKKMGRSGTGLGMAVVWGTVQDHDGHIDVHSTPQSGTTFELYFPMTDGAVTPGAEEPADIPTGGQEAILVVDDVAEQRLIATQILGQIGYAARAVSSGEAAVEYLRANNAALVILDMKMDPGIDGLETMKRILDFKPRQRIVIASGYADSAKIRRVLQLGARAYLKKPYGIASVARCVRDALTGKEKT